VPQIIGVPPQADQVFLPEADQEGQPQNTETFFSENKNHQFLPPQAAAKASPF
jgi:hypothetical protein